MTNDDGYRAEGLAALREALSSFADVTVVAPETEQSATSHTLSLHRPLRLRNVEAGVFALDGTPADCVYVGMHAKDRVLPRWPDLVVSGMNHGENLGADVFYSGTVGGAREGALRGVPALATSASMRADRRAAAALAARVARDMLAVLPGGERRQLLLNLNIPAGKGPWKVERTVLGTRLYAENVVFSTDPRGREYLWIGGATPTHDEVVGSDTEAWDAGHASLTPLVLDLTSARDEAFAAGLVESLSR